MKPLMAVALLCCLLVPPAAGETLAIRMPASDLVVFRGAFNHDPAQGGPGTMMYPGGGVLGFLVSVATHAVLVDGVREQQRRRAEADADLVLRPYRPVLDGLAYPSLMRDGLATANLQQDAKLVAASDVSDADWQLDMVPVFWFSLDQRAIVLGAAISVAKGSDRTPLWKQRVRLVSQALPMSAEEPQALWMADEGSLLKKASALLLGLAYEVSMAQAKLPAADPAGGPQRTVRFWEGAERRMERAELLEQNDCGRALIRTLRGELMSVPLAFAGEEVGASAPACIR